MVGPRSGFRQPLASASSVGFGPAHWLLHGPAWVTAAARSVLSPWTLGDAAPRSICWQFLRYRGMCQLSPLRVPKGKLLQVDHGGAVPEAELIDLASIDRRSDCAAWDPGDSGGSGDGRVLAKCAHDSHRSEKNFLVKSGDSPGIQIGSDAIWIFFDRTHEIAVDLSPELAMIRMSV